MNERHLEALAQYDLTADSVRKGRSGWICETSQGTMLLQEYRGTMKRLEFETQVLGQVRKSGLLLVDDYIRTAQGELISLSEDGTRHTLKHWYTGRECNIRDQKEIREAIGKIAVLHQILRQIERQQEWNLGSIGGGDCHEGDGASQPGASAGQELYEEQKEENGFRAVRPKQFFAVL